MFLKQRIKIFLLIVAIGFSSGCGSKKKTESVDPLTGTIKSREAKVAEEFEVASQWIDQGDYAKAAVSLDRLIVERPVSTLDGLILFNSGIAHMKNGNCKVATDRLRKAQRLSAGKMAPLELRAKLRLTEAYTCLGQSKNAMLLLLEVYRDRGALPKEIGEAEVPARLAAAYAQLGNKKMAERFFKEAEVGLKLVERDSQSSREHKQIMAKTLFTMGSLKILSPQNMESSEYYNAVISLQKYLYRAVRSEEKPWASQSADEIIAAYKNVWSFVDRVKSSETEDQVLANREERKAKAQVVMNALGALRELQRQSIPSKQSAMSSQELLATLSKEELRMKNYLATEAAGTSLSKEAQKLEALKREGRVKSEESVLEKNAKKRLPNK